MYFFTFAKSHNFSGLRKNGRKAIFIKSQKFQSFFECHFYILQEAE